MPELPEVEIARRQLERWAAGHRLRGLRIIDPAAIRTHRSTRPRDEHPEGEDALCRRVVDRIAGTPIRCGKRLGWSFDGDSGMQIHLGMTGQWMRRTPGDEPPRFAKIGLEFDGVVLWFADARRFGCVVPEDDVATAISEAIGPDAWLTPLSGTQLGERLRGRRAIKVALLDQDVLAGVGNIHAVEALWMAGIDPRTPCGSLEAEALDRLAESIYHQLDEAIRTQDTDEFRYVTQGGDNPFALYGRAGEPCLRCGTPIVQDRLGGRSTTWCPSCQPPST